METLDIAARVLELLELDDDALRQAVQDSVR
jgi:hypothetical protein